MQIFIQILILGAVLGIVGLTLVLNTKSEGLGAAITGASDTYRGAVGVEEQKRKLLQHFCTAFVVLSFIYAIFTTYTR